MIIQAKGKGTMQCWWVNQVASCPDLREKSKCEHDGEIGTAVDRDCGGGGWTGERRRLGVTTRGRHVRGAQAVAGWG